ncbi:MAG: glycosyl transferase [Proteobacteria bacterium]|nr:glycosyl transferase [Pseudomonadota bacterium]MBU1059660.1 glycosyl transferase [Pseudomonadota bacterium]
MKIACYCQHVLGIGHFHRSLEICRALAEDHDTVMILGGPEVPLPKTAVRFLKLPGLQMDKEFRHLLPCQAGSELEKIKLERKRQLFAFFTDFQPDIFLVELYPFGRKAFAFELDPILNGIGAGSLPPCLRLCSLRDILVEKKDKQKYEERVLHILNTSFEGLLIHSDPAFIPLETSFERTDAITVPLHYTGFISPPANNPRRGIDIRQELELRADDKLIVASIGGGSVGAELLHATADAAALVDAKESISVHLFTGPYSDPELQDELAKRGNDRITIHDFCANFPDWLQGADLSISMAGYNTCMNLLTAGVPALLYPFGQNREQRLRVSSFLATAPFALLEPVDLAPARLAKKIEKMLHLPKQKSKANLNGAISTAQLIGAPHAWTSKDQS